MSSQQIRSVRGMEDLMGAKAFAWRSIENKLISVFHRYGFDEIRTPLVEMEALFKRGVGEDTDIVSKEMYSFAESSAEDANTVVLRPEGTAPVVRALVEHKSYVHLPVRWYYLGQMYRKERPQKGRYRQFHQYGFEVFGNQSAWVDAEGLALVKDLLNAAGLTKFEIHVNSLGDSESRAGHKKKLLEYFNQHTDKLSELSKNRLAKNPLRILDSKDEGDQKLSENAPKTLDCLNEVSKIHWDDFLAACKKLKVDVKINTKLVRGLDYYCHTVFEIVDTSGNLGSQSALGGGGRYDGLVQDLGGPQMPAFGFAGGMERLVLALGESFEKTSTELSGFDVSVVHMGDAAHKKAAEIVQSLRAKGLRADWEPENGKGFKAQFKRADRMGSKKVYILGDDEIAKNIIKVKDMATGTETEQPLTQF